MTVVESYMFPRFVYDLLNGDSYSIGLHGVSYDRLEDVSKHSKEEVDEVLARIRENGLRIYSSRSINGTVSFAGRIDDKDDLPNVSNHLRGYRYGDSNRYVLVAIPTVIRNAKGDSIYIGKNNLSSSFSEYFSTTGNEVTSIMDEVIPFTNSKGEVSIPSEYILGSYKLLPDGKIEFTANDKHVSKNNGIVSDEEFDRINETIEVSTFSAKDVKELLEKKELSEEDEIKLEIMINRFTNYIQLLNRSYLVPLTETMKQLLNEKRIKKATREDVDLINEKPEQIDYSALYEGKTGEDLFYEQLRVIKSMEVEVFFDNGAINIHSDRDGEAEEYYRLLNDRDFVYGLLTHLNKWELVEFEIIMGYLTNDDILNDDLVSMKLMKNDRRAFETYEKRGLLSRDLLMKAATSSCFTSDSLYFLPEEYADDLELILAFVDNANENNFGFHHGFGESNFTFFNLGENVRSNPVLYERLNEKITELNETKGTNIPYFDVDKEVELVKGHHR